MVILWADVKKSTFGFDVKFDVDVKIGPRVTNVKTAVVLKRCTSVMSMKEGRGPLQPMEAE